MLHTIRFSLILALLITGSLSADNPATLDIPSQQYGKTAIDKGTVALSGTAQVIFGGGDLYKEQMQIAFQPSILKFVANRFAIGVDAAVIYNDNGESDDLQLAVGPNFAYFFGSGREKTISFIEFSPRFTRKEVSIIYQYFDPNFGDYSYTRRVELDGIQLAASLGAVNFVGKKAAITIASGFTYDILSRNSISINGYYIGLSVGLAMFLY